MVFEFLSLSEINTLIPFEVNLMDHCSRAQKTWRQELGKLGFISEAQTWGVQQAIVRVKELLNGAPVHGSA